MCGAIFSENLNVSRLGNTFFLLYPQTQKSILLIASVSIFKNKKVYQQYRYTAISFDFPLLPFSATFETDLRRCFSIMNPAFLEHLSSHFLL